MHKLKIRTKMSKRNLQNNEKFIADGAQLRVIAAINKLLRYKNVTTVKNFVSPFIIILSVRKHILKIGYGKQQTIVFIKYNKRLLPN